MSPVKSIFSKETEQQKKNEMTTQTNDLTSFGELYKQAFHNKDISSGLWIWRQERNVKILLNFGKLIEHIKIIKILEKILFLPYINNLRIRPLEASRGP